MDLISRDIEKVLISEEKIQNKINELGEGLWWQRFNANRYIKGVCTFYGRFTKKNNHTLHYGFYGGV